MCNYYHFIIETLDSNRTQATPQLMGCTNNKPSSQTYSPLIPGRNKIDS